MNYLKYYFGKLRDNIYNPAYYEQVAFQPLSRSFTYYFKMIVWLALFFTLLISIVFLPIFISLYRQVIVDVAGNYPADLKIVVQNGQASINLPEPLAIPLPQKDQAVFNAIKQATSTAVSSIDNFMVIDTKTPFTVADFGNYHAMFVLKKDSLVSLNGNNIQISPLPANTTATITAATISSWTSGIRKFIPIIAPLAVLAIYLFSLMFLVVMLVPVSIVSLLVFLLFLVARNGYTLRQAWQVTLHAITLTYLIGFFGYILYPSLSVNFPFLTAITLLVVYLNLIRRAPKAIAMPSSIPADTVIKPAETPVSPVPAPAPEVKEEVQ